MWLQGVAEAAAELGIEIQFCMACPHQALSSLDWPAVTNARVNGDSGLAVPDAVYSATLASLLGLGWSKDNLRLREEDSGVAVTAVEVQVLLAALSLGPVGLADRLEGYDSSLSPNPPPVDADVITNVTLALSLCTSDGTLLQPSVPLTPLGAQLAGKLVATSEYTDNVWATYTRTPVRLHGGEAGACYLWWSLVSFRWEQGKENK